MYFRKKTSGGRAYLQIVESRRDGAQVRQQVIATLGRIEDLRDSGQLERLLRSGARFAKFDGIFVLRTNADLSPLETMLCYKHLWMVERAFRTSKSLFATRPIFHKLDETIRGHVSCSFLALVLKKELEDRIATLGHASSWPNVLADLDSLTETEVEQDGKRFLLRTPPRPAASLALRAAGVALPPTVRQLADA